MEQKTLTEALVRASADPGFAQSLIQNPEQYREEYQLTDEQLAMISGAGLRGDPDGGATLHGYEPTQMEDNPDRNAGIDN